MNNITIDLGPELGFATLEEIPIPETEHRNDMRVLLEDLDTIKEIITEFDTLAGNQHVIKASFDNVATNIENTTEPEPPQKKQYSKILRPAAIAAGGSIGIAGFLVNPVVGISTVLVGSGVGWFLSTQRIPRDLYN